MGKNFTLKTMNEIICYWMEAVNVSNRLNDLAEYKEEATVMSLADAIEDASSKANNIKMDAEAKLKAGIQSAITSGASNFAKYSGAEYQNKLDDLMNMLYDQFDDIDGYSQQEQIDNFYDILCSSLDELVVA